MSFHPSHLSVSSASRAGSRPSSAASRKSDDLPDRLEADRNELLDELIPWITSKSPEKKVQDLETVVNLIAKSKETSTVKEAGVRTPSRIVDEMIYTDGPCADTATTRQKLIAASTARIVTYETLEFIPNVASMAEQKRFFDVLLYFKEMNLITWEPVKKALDDFWSKQAFWIPRDAGSTLPYLLTCCIICLPAGENIDDKEKRKAEIAKRRKWKDLDGGTLIGIGALDDVANPTAVFRALFEEELGKHDPKHRAAFVAAARYLYHAKSQLEMATMENEKDGRAGPGLHFGPNVPEFYKEDFGHAPYFMARFTGWVTKFKVVAGI
ncbi:hypothetical protein PG984_000297 [Apiospora sp. TS-2023a]